MHGLGWHTEKIHGNQYQMDFPDLFCMHPTMGTRWIEMKKSGTVLRPGQRRKFTTWMKYGVMVWVLRGRDEYFKLMKPSNLVQELHGL